MGRAKGSTRQRDAADDRRRSRNYPQHTLEAALVLPQKIQDESGGRPMNRLLLADALGMSPSSSNYRTLLSSAYKYGLTEGTEKAETISLTPNGTAATQQSDQGARLSALRKAALTPPVFGKFFRDYANKKLPSAEMLPKILRAQYEVPSDLTVECASHITGNGKYVDVIREIGGSPHILLGAEIALPPSDAESLEQPANEGSGLPLSEPAVDMAKAPAIPPPPVTPRLPTHGGPKPIFLGHGKNKAPLEQLQRLLTTFQIPHKVVVEEANLGRPIPQKVKDTIEECGSAILIFTRDEKLFDEGGKEIWRPSENVVHELGATSFAYGDRIVIFKEKGLSFPSNFQSIGYIEFESGDLTARTADLLRELIGFGLVRVTPTT